MNYNNLYSVFLSIDFLSAISGLVGSIIIFRYGLSPKIDSDGHNNLITEQVNKKEKEQARDYREISNVGIGLISLSFFLQIIKLFIRAL